MKSTLNLVSLRTACSYAMCFSSVLMKVSFSANKLFFKYHVVLLARPISSDLVKPNFQVLIVDIWYRFLLLLLFLLCISLSILQGGVVSDKRGGRGEAVSRCWICWMQGFALLASYIKGNFGWLSQPARPYMIFFPYALGSI